MKTILEHPSKKLFDWNASQSSVELFLKNNELRNHHRGREIRAQRWKSWS